jgi:cytoskeletal protein CcmA (bactofilin family)
MIRSKMVGSNTGRLGMGIVKKVSLILGATVAVLGLGAGVAFAASGESVISGTTDHTIYKTDRTVTITGTVNGDIFCAGQTITIDAVVNGDVLCAGQTVTVNGTVYGNVRVAGQTVNIGANVERSATLAAQDATLQSNARVGSDVGVVAQTATIDSLVGRDVRGASNTLTLNSRVSRNVEANVNKLELDRSAELAGNLTYTSPNKLNESSGATIAGSVTYHKAKPNRHNQMNWGHLWVLKSLYVSLTLLVFSMVLVAIFPQLFGRWNKRSAAKPWAALLTGFVAMFVVPALMVALAVTVAGMPLAVFVMLAWVLALFLSAPIAAFYLGSLILRHEKHAPLIMLAGAVVLGLVCLVPILGGLVSVVAMWFGTGSLLTNLKPLYKKPQYEV